MCVPRHSLYMYIKERTTCCALQQHEYSAENERKKKPLQNLEKKPRAQQTRGEVALRTDAPSQDRRGEQRRIAAAEKKTTLSRFEGCLKWRKNTHTLERCTNKNEKRSPTRMHDRTKKNDVYEKKREGRVGGGVRMYMYTRNTTLPQPLYPPRSPLSHSRCGHYPTLVGELLALLAAFALFFSNNAPVTKRISAQSGSI